MYTEKLQGNTSRKKTWRFSMLHRCVQGNFFDKTWKIQSMQRKFLQNIYATCKIFQNFEEFYKIL